MYFLKERLIYKSLINYLITLFANKIKYMSQNYQNDIEKTRKNK